jgi:hypothetical protein
MNDPRLERYLLGDLPEEEQDALERDFFRSDETFDLLQAAEDDLIDAYVAGTLPAEATGKLRERLERTPARRARVELARALRKAAHRAARPAARPSTTWISLAAVLAVGFAGSLVMLRAVQRDLHEAREEHTTATRRAEDLARELDLTREASGGIAAQELTPGSERDIHSTRAVTLTDATAWMRLRLVLPASAPAAALTATLETPDGRTLAELHDLRARDGAVEVMWPARGLAPGTYIVTLRTARESVESYTLRIARRQS